MSSLCLHWPSCLNSLVHCFSFPPHNSGANVIITEEREREKVAEGQAWNTTKINMHLFFSFPSCSGKGLTEGSCSPKTVCHLTKDIFHLFIHLCMCMHVYVGRCACHRACVEIREQLIKAGSLISVCRSWGSNSGCHIWQQQAFTHWATSLALTAQTSYSYSWAWPTVYDHHLFDAHFCLLWRWQEVVRMFSSIFSSFLMNGRIYYSNNVPTSTAETKILFHFK